MWCYSSCCHVNDLSRLRVTDENASCLYIVFYEHSDISVKNVDVYIDKGPFTVQILIEVETAQRLSVGFS
jgi:hypothetical protein